MVDFYLWIGLVLILAIAGLGIYFREWFYVFPRDREKTTGKKTTFLEYIGLFVLSIIILVCLFFWQYYTQD
ncbi:hypothetical protein SAMN04488700_1452 [Carnobacterium iners]|uniref:Uncharacterized protein n=1 Tax=Carnobacterium iners TaxID=1073423 RepID=A0A1X7N819_9LACT|nr:hypothetical protein [Carnobacterium iners]SEK44848.1 hypothetical protein SAMN04488114_10443 [Carnobacterium iners]SMH32818.1 hypothetical protein SAMN04488700_1452 [Carnobacterium iners]